MLMLAPRRTIGTSSRLTASPAALSAPLVAVGASKAGLAGGAVGGDPVMFGLTSLGLLGLAALGGGAWVFFTGMSGGWGLGLMTAGLGSALYAETAYSTIGLAMMVLGPVGAWYLYTQRPDVIDWYQKTFGKKA